MAMMTPMSVSEAVLLLEYSFYGPQATNITLRGSLPDSSKST